jgi:hypothetical protein
VAGAGPKRRRRSPGTAGPVWTDNAAGVDVPRRGRAVLLHGLRLARVCAELPPNRGTPAE